MGKQEPASRSGTEPQSDSTAQQAPPSAAPGRQPKRRKWLRRSGWGLLALLLALLLLVFVTPLRNGVLAPAIVRIARPWVVGEGGELSVASFAGNGWSHIELAGVVFDSGPKGPDATRIQFRSKRIAADYGLRELVGGDLSALAAVEASGVRLALELPSEPVDEMEAEEAAPFELPDSLPRVDVRDLEVRLELGNAAARSTLRVASAAVQSGPRSPEGEPQALTLGETDLEWDDGVSPLEATLELDAKYAAGVIETDALRLNGRRLVGTGRLECAASGYGWDLMVAPDAGGLQVAGNFDGQDLSSALSATELDLAEVARLLEPLGLLPTEPEGAAPIGGRVALDAQLEWPAAAEPDAELTLRGRGLRYEQYRVDSVALSGNLGEGMLSELEADVEAAGDRVLLRGGTLPLEEALGPRFLAALSGILEVDVRDLPQWIAPASELEAPEHHLGLRAVLEAGGGAQLSGQLEFADGGRVELRRGQLELPESLSAPLGDLQLETELTLDLPDLARVGAVLGSEEWGGRINGVLELAGSLAQPEGTLLIDGQDVTIDGLPLGRIDVLAGVDARRIEIASLASDGAVGHLDATGRYVFASRELEDVDFHLAVRDASRFGIASGEGAEGRIALAGQLAGAPAELSGAWNLEASALNLAGIVIGGVVGRGEFNAGTARVEELVIDSPHGSVNLGLELAPLGDSSGTWQARLERVVLATETSRLELAAPADVHFGAGGIEVNDVNLVGADELLSISGSFVPAESAGTGEAEWDASVRAELEGLLALARPFLPGEFDLGRLSLEFEGSRVLGEDSGQLDLRVEGLRAGSEMPPGRLELAANLGQRRLTADSLVLTLGDGTDVQARGSLPFDLGAPLQLPEGSVDWDARFDVPMLATFLPDVSGGLTGELRAEGRVRSLQVEAQLALSQVETLIQTARGAEPLGPLDGAVRLRWAEVLTLEQLDVDAPVGRIRAEGQAELAADLVALLATDGDAPGPWMDAPLALTATFELDETARAAEWTDSLRSLDGQLQGDVTLGGTLSTPQLEGGVRWSDGAMKLASDLPAFGELQADLRFAGRQVVIERLDGEMGGAPFEVTGDVGLETGAESVNIVLKGTDLLLFRRDGVKVRADADLQVAGRLDELTAKGSILLRDSRFVKNIDFLSFGRGGSRPDTGARGFSLFSFREPPLADLRFDIDVDSAQPFRLQNNVVKGGVRPDLHLGGTGLVPILSGPIYLEPTTVSLPAARLRMTGGTIRFEEESFDGPRLELSGESRTRGYDVQLAITGSMNEPEVNLSSVPPLPRQDLVVLLLTGQTPEAADAQTGAQNLALFLALDAGSRWFSDESTEAEASVLERIDVFTGGDVTESGDETVEVNFRITDDEHAGRLMYLTAERDVYDRINFGLRFLFRLP